MALLPVKHQTSLSGNTVLLCRFLRKKGFAIGSLEEIEALRAITFLPIHKEEYFRSALKSVLSKSAYQRKHFDEFYLEFKDELKKSSDSKLKEKEDKKDKKSQAEKTQAQFESLKNWLNLNASDEEKQVASYSDIEIMARKNFSDLSQEEMQLMMRLLKKVARKIAHQKSRLKKGSKKRKHINLKSTIRTNMRRGGEITEIRFSEKKEKKLKLVLLCDVSRSMELYSRFFVHLIYAFQNAYDKIETFVFSTALHQVSELLDNHEFDKAFEIISDRVPQWSGGTTIGSCLNDFVEDHSYRMLDKKTIVLILSDGWDTGAAEIMRTAMQTIYKKSKKVIWLNPLAGSTDFSPDALGLKTALPYIDVLASAHNLESLKRAISQIQKKRNLLNRAYI